MAQAQPSPNPKSESPKLPLRSIGDLISAQEWVFQAVQSGTIDQKTADSLNTCLKGSTYLLAKLRLDAAKILLQAQIKKVTFPDKMLPELG